MEEVIRAGSDENFALVGVMLRLLVAARKNGMSVEPTEDEWRSLLRLGDDVAVSLYGDERRIIDTILKCECTSPNECGRTIVRICTIRGLLSAPPE